MVYYNLSKWTISEETEGLLFFAQRIEEILCHYTLDSFKGRLLNTPLLIIEAQKTISDIENEKINNSHIKYIIEELNWSLKQDRVANKLLDIERELYYPINFDPKSTNYDELKDILSLLAKKLVNRKYESVCRHLLTDAIKDNKKKDINALCESWICILQYMDYSRSWLYHYVVNFFFRAKNEIKSKDILDAFFSKIDFKEKLFHVYCIADAHLEKAITAIQLSSISITNIPNELLANARATAYKNKKNAKRIFIRCEVKHCDPYTAFQTTTDIIDNIRDLFGFYYHKNSPNVLDEKLVVNQDDLSDITLLSSQEQPMINTTNKIGITTAANKLTKLFGGLTPSPQTTVKIFRVFDLHSSCIQNRNLENQILNLWTALEVIVPLKQHEDKSKIEQISTIISQSSTLGYCYKLVKETLDYFLIWNRGLVNKHIYSLNNKYGDKLFNKFLAFIVLDELEQNRITLYSDLNNFPLLRFRIYQLHESMHSPQCLLTLFKNHSQKLMWHLRRLYRTRNLIVHDNNTIYRLENLVSNCHLYVDDFTKLMLRLIQNDRSIETIEQGVIYIELTYQHRINKLKSSDIIDITNYQSLLLWK